MAPTAAGERTGAGGSSAALRSPVAADRLLSPGGYLAVAVGLVVTIVIVLRSTAAFQDAGGAAPAPDGYEEVDLGQLNRDLAPEAGGLVRDPFMLRVVVVLNPKARDLGGLKLQVERRRNLFRDIVWSEILNPKTDADLRKPAVLESLKSEIRQRLNQELSGTKDGQEMIVRVIFPERRLPERR
ncbi:MAG: flagellar basal body-associated FliL family protein [Planctomycetaceae bacterium]|nr:flagellar basal body-associated FliL family protein [Planctomycetaceae bacterium]